MWTFKRRYHIVNNGQRVQVCIKTVLDIFQLKRGTTDILQIKIAAGKSYITDGRGHHDSRSKISDDIIIRMKSHIDSFPKYNTHYTRRQNGDYYLSSDLTVSRMFNLFIEAFPDIPQVAKKMQIYRNIFRESGLRIGQPKSDTCKTCDRLRMQSISAVTQGRKRIKVC